MRHLAGRHLAAGAALAVLILGLVLFPRLPVIIGSPLPPWPAGAQGGGSVSTGGNWTVRRMPEPGAELTSISCPASWWCMAGGNEDSSSQRPVFLFFDGSSWTSVGAPATRQQEWSLVVDCPSVGFCVATNGQDNGYWVYAHGAWSAERFLPGSSSQDGGPADISCASPTFCMAIPGGAGQRYAVYNGATWTSGTFDAQLTNPSEVAVDCAGPRLCVMAARGDHDGHTLLTYDGSRWSVSYRGFGAGSVDCTGDFCLAANGFDAISYRDGRWSRPVPLWPAPRAATRIRLLPAPDATGGSTDLSCPVSGECYLVTVQWQTSGRDQWPVADFFQTFRGGRLSNPVSLLNEPSVPGEPPLSAPFSCPTPSYCVMASASPPDGSPGYAVYTSG